MQWPEQGGLEAGLLAAVIDKKEKRCVGSEFSHFNSTFTEHLLGTRHCAGYWVFRSLYDKSYIAKEFTFWKRREICSQTISKQGVM